LSGLRETLSDKEAVAAYVEAYNEERRKFAKTATSRRAKLEKRQDENKREHERAVDAILKVLPLRRCKSALRGLRPNAIRSRAT
jgi:hypothetical protein